MPRTRPTPLARLAPAIAAALLPALAAGAVLCAGARDAGAQTAPVPPAMFRGGPARAGVYAVAGVPRFGGLRWRVQTGGTLRSSPTLSDGVVYIGGGDGALWAIDAAAGDVRWRRELGSALPSTPAVAGGRVYVATRDGRLVALRTRDGVAVWTARAGADAPLAWGYESGEVYVSSPAVAGRLVVWGAGDGRVFAADAATGTVRWSYRTGGRVRSSPAVEGGTVFVGAQDGVVYALDLATGALRWRHETEGHSLVSARFGYDRRTIQSSPAVVGGAVYIGARDGFLYALDRATGRRRWRNDHRISWVNSSPAVAAGLVVAGSSDGHFVHAVDTATGEERWRHQTTGTVWSSPSTDGRLVYVGEGDGTVYALDLRTGAEAWRYRAGARVFSSPTPADGALYFGSDDGGVYAVRAAEGAPLRRAVFWDSTHARFSSVPSHAALRSYLAARGYETLDAGALRRWLDERTRERASGSSSASGAGGGAGGAAGVAAGPSVVVFAIDHLPPGLGPAGSDPGLLRRYLDAGGKVVWTGIPPLLWPRPDTGTRTLLGVDRKAAASLLGVRHERGNFDAVGVSTITPSGRRAGLSGWWMSDWPADPEDVTEVLALDEQGLAAAWIKSYGGARGTGFARVPVGDGLPGRQTSMAGVQAVAEWLPDR